jgi:hypothetical protein
MFKRREPRAEGQPRFGDRRKMKRQTAGWQSRYRIVDEGRERYHYGGEDYEPCVLSDLSMQGAGLHITEGDVSVGDRVEIDLPLGAHKRATIQVRGEIKHAGADGEGQPHAGIEFVDLGDLERALLLRLLRDMESTASQSA